MLPVQTNIVAVEHPAARAWAVELERHGVLTGTVLSLARALGETAPLILTGAVLTTYLSSRPAGLLEQLRGDYTALPVVIYTWARQAKPAFKTELASAAILVLLAITVLCNLGAVLLRNRYEKRRVG